MLLEEREANQRQSRRLYEICSREQPAGVLFATAKADFTGGTYGSAIVLLRPVTPRDNPTASTEYDTYSQSITLPGTYYQVMANGTISSTPITTTKLRGGEAGIYVTQGQ